MSRRSRGGRRRSWSPRCKAQEFLARRGQRKRKAFSFERLEDRFAFSATTTPLQYQMSSLSNDTPEGAAALLERELAWAIMQYAAAGWTQAEITTTSLPNDPLFPQQWHLQNTGQDVGNPDFQDLFGVPGEDINVVEAWDLGYTGDGVIVAVIDSGMQLDHPDLIANVHPTLRLNAINNGSNVNPSPLDPLSFHGTAVAGLIGATANNGIGGTGVAPGVQLVPIKMSTFDSVETNRAFQYGLGEIDITNNSWGTDEPRRAIPLAVEEFTALRDTVIFGRDGLGTIHVFAAGNDAGPGFVDGFEDFGFLDSAAYNPWVNSRYTIGVTGVDHDGLYFNADGTFTSYAETSAAVLVAAPTGSNKAQNVADDTGQGSGIVTTDLTGDDGANAAPLPSGFEFDRDFLLDPDYMSRFNGTSASAPIVSGVIALMLEANPDLTWRDVQEILVRSARQNAQFEVASGALSRFGQNSWQTNQIGIFRNPDVYDPAIIVDAEGKIRAVSSPLEGGQQIIVDEKGNETIILNPISQPALFTNGAGYTVSQGYGSYGEQIGYAHGVVDAGLAVKMAEQWDQVGQNINPNTELTYTTFVDQLLLAGNLPAGAKITPEGEGFGDVSDFVVPGALGGKAGFIDYWNEYFVEDDPDNPDDGPFMEYDGPMADARGSHLTFGVPDSQAMSVEWVEVKVSIEGPTEDLDYLRMVLVSPEGTHSELNHVYGDPTFRSEEGVVRTQPGMGPPRFLDVSQGMDPDGGNFVWTFSTNRNWGERSSDAVIIDPVTGEPIENEFGIAGQTRGWELHVENWSDSMFQLSALEVVWHGKPLNPNTERVQGFVGLDRDGDQDFNYDRSFQSIGDNDEDPATIRLGDVDRSLDGAQEPFAENMLVQAFRVVDGIVQSVAAAQFLTGADGNYYFDLVPGDYMIRVTDPLDREFLNDLATDSEHLQNFRSEWLISADWFFAPDREDADPPDPTLGPGLIKYDAALGAPFPFLDEFGDAVPMGIKNLNFLVVDEGPPAVANITGIVFNDKVTNGLRDTGEPGVGQVRVFIDANRNGSFDDGEIESISSSDGTFSFAGVAPGSYRIAIETSSTWELTAPELGYYEMIEVVEGGTVTGLLFGLHSLVDHDWGDLPDSYNMKADGSIDPPRHFIITDDAGVPGFYLGSVGSDIDGELTGGGDGLGMNEEDDGVQIMTNGEQLQLGPNTLRVTVTGFGGILNGWIDWNDDKKFDANEHLVWEDAQGNFFNQIHLDSGQSWDLKITVPLYTASGRLAARFRWGEPGLDFFGPATHGEVEDYFLPSTVPVAIAGDFDRSGLVDEQDAMVWRATFGSTTDMRADSNKDNVVDAADYIMWRKNLGAGSSSASAVASISSVPNPSSAPAVESYVAVYYVPDAPIVQSQQQSSGNTATDVAQGEAIGPSATTGSNDSSVTLPSLRDSGSETPVGDISLGALDVFVVQVRDSSAPTVLVESTASAAVLDRNLLLVDEVWADLEADEDGEALVSRGDDEDDDPLSELALAAVFAGDDSWWNGP